MADVTVNGPVPPLIAKVSVAPVALEAVPEVGATTRAAGGTTGAVIVTRVVPETVPTDALIVAEEFTVTAGAVYDDVAMPPVVWENGVIAPPPDEMLKFTDVPSGTGVPAVVVTFAVIADVPADATVEGVAVTATVLTVTGFKNRLITLKAPMSAVAVILSTVSIVLRMTGSTLTRVEACPLMSVWTSACVGSEESGNVASTLSEPKVTRLLTAGVPSAFLTVAVITAVLSPAVSKRIELLVVSVSVGSGSGTGTGNNPPGAPISNTEKKTVFLSLIFSVPAFTSAWTVANPEVVE